MIFVLFSFSSLFLSFFFFFTDPATTEIYTLSLHDALPILVLVEDPPRALDVDVVGRLLLPGHRHERSEEHTSELQSHSDLVCRLLLEKKKKKQHTNTYDEYKHHYQATNAISLPSRAVI